MRLSCVTSVFVNYALPDAIRQIADAGFEGVDIWAGRPHAYRHDHSPQELARVRGLLDDLGLKVPSLMPAFYRYPHNLGSPNEIAREDSLDYMRQCADNAAALGAGYLLIVPSLTLHGQSVDDARGRLCDSIGTISDYVRQYDLRLGIEPANRGANNLINTAADALALMESLGCDNVGVVMDTGHLQLSDESAAEALDRLGRHLLQIHVNDNDGRRQQNAIPGDGVFDFAALVRLLRNVGYDGYLSVEIGWDYSPNPAPAVRVAAERMRAFLAGN